MAEVQAGVGGTQPRQAGGEASLVDPRAPRFGQALTATGLTVAIALREPLLVVAVAAVLCTAVASGWRLNLYGVLWRHLAVPVVGATDDPEPAAPHRFATLMGAGFTGLATVAFAADAVLAPAAVAAGLSAPALAGYALAGVVAALAGLAAITDICVGCRMYQQVSFFRRLGVV